MQKIICLLLMLVSIGLFVTYVISKTTQDNTAKAYQSGYEHGFLDGRLTR